MLGITVAHNIDNIGQETWDRFSAGRPFASYRWYRFGEKVMAGNRPFYILVYDQGEPVARATFWLIDNEPLPITFKPLRSAVQKALRAYPLLVCRSPLSGTSGLILPNSPLRKPVLEAICKAAAEFGRLEKASFMVFDYLNKDQSAADDWPGGLMKLNAGDPDTKLLIQWDSFEDYLAGLSKTAWKDYRRHRNHAARLKINITASSRVDRIDEALQLIRNVEIRHDNSPKPWARAMLENAHMVPCVWITAEVEDRLAGCGLLLSDQGEQVASLLGLDYSQPYVYFQLVYQAIQQAVEQKMRVLRMGSGAYPLKMRLGCQLDNNTEVRAAWRGTFSRLGFGRALLSQQKTVRGSFVQRLSSFNVPED
ncbi:MAG: GNAT family N-acetyltransferase [Chloroflexi bacterium]|nr:GNAT family N-acetyltransferase [Chloroflexota bacterium]